MKLLTDMKVTRPVAEALVTEHPERIREVVQAMRTRLAQGFKPRSLGAATVDAVRNPEKYVAAQSPGRNDTAARSRTSGKARGEPQPVLLPLTQSESLGMIRNILKVKLGRAPHAAAVARLASLPQDAIEQLVAAAKGQGDLIEAVRAATGEAPDRQSTRLVPGTRRGASWAQASTRPGSVPRSWMLNPVAARACLFSRCISKRPGVWID
ncbi:hypothetical protein ACFP9V_23070 [Deinococcus radiopugnans]|uniref:hypothetical protein n=1 Tax=Deinococcus radiopugnans TaxID=57497 RepID=UPI00360829F5